MLARREAADSRFRGSSQRQPSVVMDVQHVGDLIKKKRKYLLPLADRLLLELT